MKLKGLKVKIELLSKKHYNSYNTFLHNLAVDGSLFYYSVSYMLFLKRLLACESEYYIVLDNEKVVAALPMMFKDGCLGKVYNSLPFYGSHGGIISCNDIAKIMLIDKFNKLSGLKGVAVNMLVENPFCINNGINYNYSDDRISQYTNIKYVLDNDDSLLKTFHYKTRNMIRKAQKSSINVVNNSMYLDFLYTTHLENMHQIGGVAKPKIFFDSINQYFRSGQDYRLYVALYDKKPIAALLLFYYKDVVEYFTPVIKKEHRSLQPMSLLIYRAMLDAGKEGYCYWNWGGTWKSQAGVYRFKSRFAAVDRPYKYKVNLVNNSILECSPEDLLAEYKGFYTIPFQNIREKTI